MNQTTNIKITHMVSDSSRLQASFHVNTNSWFRLNIQYRNSHDAVKSSIYIDGLPYGETWFPSTKEGKLKELVELPFTIGDHTLVIEFINKTIVVDNVTFEAASEPIRPIPSFSLNNPDASEEAKELMSYLKSIYGKKILSGQQTTYTIATELDAIRKITGKLPAVRGFDLLSYSPACDTPNQSDHCMEEIENNQGAIEAAIDWAKNKNGIVTFCWHWFSPIKGEDKSFYSKFTNFNAARSVIPGTMEFEAVIHDIDSIAVHLKKLEAEHIPVLWRPLHEADGDWFWWGGNSDTFKKLYRLLYDRLTNHHKINNLIWVLNVLGNDYYPGDEFVDLVSADQYPPAYQYGPLTCVYNHIADYNPDKAAALGEIGTFPNPDLIRETKTPWLWFVTWCGGFITSEDYTKHDYVKYVYNHPDVITLDDLK